MITVNRDTENYKDMKLNDIIGFAVDNGYFFIDVDEDYLVSFWKGQTTCDVTNLSDNNIYMDSTLNDLVTTLRICDIYDVVKVFTDDEDFTLALLW